MTLSNKTTETQIGEILAYLKAGNGLTKLEAIKRFGTLNLNGRAWDLRKKGFDVVSVWERGPNRHGRMVNFKRYFLSDHKPPSAVPIALIAPKVSKAQKRLESALFYLHENLDPGLGSIVSIMENGKAIGQALKIAAGLK